MDWNFWINKQVFVKLKKGACYSGKIIEIINYNNPSFILIDKFGDKIIFSISEVVKLKEETNKIYAQNLKNYDKNHNLS